MRALAGGLDPGSDNKLTGERMVNMNQKRMEGVWRVYHVEETACAKILMEGEYGWSSEKRGWLVPDNEGRLTLSCGQW